MCQSSCTLSTAVVAFPIEAFGARLNDTVTTGNCPCRLIESGALSSSKCANALSGTAEPFAPVTAAGFADPDPDPPAAPLPLPVVVVVATTPAADGATA